MQGICHSLSVITVTTNICIFNTLGYRFQLYRAIIRPVQNCENQTGMSNIKVIKAGQAYIHRYKNLRTKL
jgi:hypothetical protein